MRGSPGPPVAGRPAARSLHAGGPFGPVRPGPFAQCGVARAMCLLGTGCRCAAHISGGPNSGSLGSEFDRCRAGSGPGRREQLRIAHASSLCGVRCAASREAAPRTCSIPPGHDEPCLPVQGAGRRLLGGEGHAIPLCRESNGAAVRAQAKASPAGGRGVPSAQEMRAPPAATLLLACCSGSQQARTCAGQEYGNNANQYLIRKRSKNVKHAHSRN
jgi:hypothetical protein